MPPEESCPLAVGWLIGSAILIYAPTYQRQREPPMAPTIKRLRRPNLSIRKNSQIRVKTVLMTPKMPVVKRELFVPCTPMDLKTVGE